MEKINTLCNGKRVLFISTKNLDYIRNTQEVALISQKASNIKIIGSNSKSYLVRLAYVYAHLLVQRMRNIDVVFVGFAPQLVLPVFYHKLKKKVVIIDFFISVYDTFVCDRSKVRKDSLLAKVSHKLDQRTLEKTDIII